MAKQTRNDLPGYLDQLVQTLQENAWDALRTWDQKAVHHARVATRRLKAAMDLLKPVLNRSKRKPFSRALKKLRKRLGPVRDLDVMLTHLDELPRSGKNADAVIWLAEQLHRQRDEARRQATDHSSPSRTLSKLDSWDDVREQIQDSSDEIDALLAKSLHLQLDAFVERSDAMKAGGIIPDPHALRIAGKSLRYTLEMAAEHGHELPKALLATFKKLQDDLGLWHDYVVLSQQAMRTSIEESVPLHDLRLQRQIIDLTEGWLAEAGRQLEAFRKRWARIGSDLAREIRLRFPLDIA